MKFNFAKRVFFPYALVHVPMRGLKPIIFLTKIPILSDVFKQESGHVKNVKNVDTSFLKQTLQML